MNWEAIGAIGSLLGAAGVIATLGYLAYQIRQNTRQLVQNELSSKASAVNASATALREVRRSVYENEELSAILWSGMKDPLELPENDLQRYRLVMQNIVDAIWDIHSQTVGTGFTPEVWETQGAGVVRRIVASPGGRWFWTQSGKNYTEEFRRGIDRILAEESADSRPEFVQWMEEIVVTER